MVIGASAETLEGIAAATEATLRKVEQAEAIPRNVDIVEYSMIQYDSHIYIHTYIYIYILS